MIGEDFDKCDYIVFNDKVEVIGFLFKYFLEDGIFEFVKGYNMILNIKYSNV